MASCRLYLVSLRGERSLMLLHSVIFALVLGTLSLPILAEAKSKPPATPEQNPKRKGAVSKPKRLHSSEAQSSPWTDVEVATAKGKCTALLSGIRLDFEPLPPIQQGSCGTPAPILLRSLGADHMVELDPPATVSCDLAKALSEWVDAVQREAKQLLGSAVVKLHASSYACRNIYNRAKPPLSQHALANAFDIGGFVLSSGEHITVREDWQRKSAENHSPVHLASTAVSLPTLKRASDQRSDFVLRAHETACSIFGTVLGPRANKAHADHFHLDMKQRDRSICR
jgi:hypothetical protein